MALTDAQADATRDALAMLRAAAAGDREGLAVVAYHVADPRLVVALLASWFAEAAAECGLDLPAGATVYQQGQGLL